MNCPPRARKNVRLFHLISPVLIVLFTSQLLSQPSEGGERFLEYEKYSREIVATIGDHKITAQEFLLNYEFGPAFLKRKAGSKKRYLELMIYEKLLAMYGYQEGLDQKESVVRSCRAYAEDIATEQLFKQEIMDHITVTDEEIEGALPEELKQLSVKWLFSERESEIFERWQDLKRGVSFDSLYTMQFNDSVAEKDRSMEISAYRLTLKNPALASIIDTVAAGNFTNPIKVPDGWYIVKIDRIFNDLITTQTQLQKVKHELERSIFKQKMDALSEMYVSNLMADQAPEIDRDTFREVVYYLNKTARYPDTFDRIALDTHLAAEVHSPADTGQGGYLDSVLVVGKSLHLTLKDFIDWYRPRMAYLKYPQDTEVAFIFAVQQTVWRMVRDFLLINKAHEFNLDQVEAVRKQVSWWRDKIVYNAVKSELLASVQFNEQDLVKFYDENLRDYRYADGNTIPFEKARKNVESDYVREKYMTMVMRKVLQLKREYDIGIDEQVLEKIVVQDEDDPGAIDFYAVKKGGLLPRQPYPTIDWEWQAWE